MLRDLNYEIERTNANGDSFISEFSGAMRQVDLNFLEEGDSWEFNEIKPRKGMLNGREVQYCFITVTKKNNEQQIVQFYPSTFTKSRQIVDENGIPTGTRKHTEGTAAELFRSQPSVQAGMQALLGKKCKVTKAEEIRVLRFGSKEVTNTSILTIDLV